MHQSFPQSILHQTEHSTGLKAGGTLGKSTVKSQLRQTSAPANDNDDCAHFKKVETFSGTKDVTLTGKKDKNFTGNGDWTNRVEDKTSTENGDYWPNLTEDETSH